MYGKTLWQNQDRLKFNQDSFIPAEPKWIKYFNEWIFKYNGNRIKVQIIDIKQTPNETAFKLELILNENIEVSIEFHSQSNVIGTIPFLMVYKQKLPLQEYFSILNLRDSNSREKYIMIKNGLPIECDSDPLVQIIRRILPNEANILKPIKGARYFSKYHENTYLGRRVITRSSSLSTTITIEPLQENGVELPVCHFINSKTNKFCSKCGNQFE